MFYHRDFAHIISNKKPFHVECEHVYFKIMPIETQRLRKVSNALDTLCNQFVAQLTGEFWMVTFLPGHQCPSFTLIGPPALA